MSVTCRLSFGLSKPATYPWANRYLSLNLRPYELRLQVGTVSEFDLLDFKGFLPLNISGVSFLTL
jgi:hypothetical protein